MVKTRAAALREKTPTDMIQSSTGTSSSPTAPEAHISSGLIITPHPHWSSIIHILVGPERTSFIVHRSVLTTIHFFKTCLDAGMQESNTGQVTLPEDEAEISAQVIRFAYCGKLEYDLYKLWRDCKITNGTRKTTKMYNEQTMELLKVYTLSHRLGYEQLQNYCVDIMRISLGYRRLRVDEMSFMLNKTLPVQALPRLVLDATAYDISTVTGGWKAWKKKQGSQYRVLVKENPDTHELLTEAVAEYKREGPPCYSLDVCRWHLHGAAAVGKDCPQLRVEKFLHVDDMVDWDDME